MRIRRTSHFKKRFKKLSRVDQDRVETASRMFAENPYHPSLQTAKLTPKSKGMWYIRASQSLRITFTWDEENVILRTVGTHNII